jgi:hypothetical protein
MRNYLSNPNLMNEKLWDKVKIKKIQLGCSFIFALDGILYSFLEINF